MNFKVRNSRDIAVSIASQEYTILIKRGRIEGYEKVLKNTDIIKSTNFH